MSQLKEIANLLGIESNKKLKSKILKKLKMVPYIPFPTAFHTVDIIPTRKTLNGLEILLGKKHNRTDWVFIGGFVDPTNSAETAALRELEEETMIHIKESERLNYLGSLFIDDRRYQNSCHKITTSIFTVEVNKDEAMLAKGGDDIEEVSWFNYTELLENHEKIISVNHVPLFYVFKNWLENKL